MIAYHLVLTAYGFWLPNDPRGSWSDEVRVFALRPFGAATKVNTRRSVAKVEHNRLRRVSAKSALKYPPVKFNGVQARAVARGIAEVCGSHQVMVRAAAVMPDHVHLVVDRHAAVSIEDVARRFKAAATRRLNHEGVGFRRSPWAKGRWSVFLRDEAAVVRAVRYVEQNPARAGLRPQRWSFVTAMDG
ncbi:MAG: transposase [Planctomycetota bacterium]